MPEENHHWYMVTVIGKDRPGIVARLSTALYEQGCHLGEASMMRLGGNFTIMLMARCPENYPDLSARLNMAMASLELHIHCDRICGELHQHREPDVRINVYGADRAGIVARVTSILAAAGLDILNLESDVAGNELAPIYLMRIEGCATQGIDALHSALSTIDPTEIAITITAIQTVFG